MKRNTSAQDMQASEQLTMFLATNNSILTQVKTKMRETEGYEGLFCDIINTFVKMYEDHLWVLPDQKLRIIKVRCREVLKVFCQLRYLDWN